MIELSAIEKVYRAARIETVALTGIDMAVGAGEFISIMGPSGCGKSTLLRVIGDLIDPSEGEVEVHGKSAAAARKGREYGMVFQQAGLMDWRTVPR